MADQNSSKQAQDEMQRRSIGREILNAAANEMGFAVNSIRQEVVEKGWFGEKVTPQFMLEWQRDDEPSPSISTPQDFSREDLYGRDAPEIEQSKERDRDPEIDR